MDYAVHGILHTGVGSLSLLQGIFPTQGSNPGPLHCRRIFFFYQLSYQGSQSSLESLTKTVVVIHKLEASKLQPTAKIWPAAYFYK